MSPALLTTVPMSRSLLIYEYITGGGLWREAPGVAPEGSLLREGAAMVQTVTADFVAAGIQVTVLRDRRLPQLELPDCESIEIGSAKQELSALREAAAAADATLLIAPESGGALTTRCREVEQAGGRLLGPDSALVEMASDKLATTRRLMSAGIPVPTAVPFSPGAAIPGDFAYPAVLKPRDGAGSQGIRLIDAEKTPVDGHLVEDESDEWAEEWVLESFQPGLAASVAVLCGPRGCFPLPAWRQELSGDGRFRYLGGSFPLPEPLDGRARRLAVAAIEALGGGRGYLGVDLVLGESEQGEADAVIEVNPRLTTSYVGLRQAARFNLAEAMRAIALGETPPSLSFDRQAIRFQIADFGLKVRTSNGSHSKSAI